MNKLYPFKFTPIYKERIWGGTGLKQVLNKNTESDIVGESWEISGLEGSESVVCNGDLKGENLNELIASYGTDLLGKSVVDVYGNDFPLLIKFIDAKQDLSLQVHPGDEVAMKRHSSFGKNEMWYIMEAEEKSTLISGFKTKVSIEEYKLMVENGDITKVLNYESVGSGDVFDIPAGRVHAIGAGVMLAEIQQSSDVTYRISDWNRLDAEGNTRELHTKLAEDVIDFEVYENYKTQAIKKNDIKSELVSSKYFTTNLLKISENTELNYTDKDSFVIYVVVEGNANLIYNNTECSVKKGESILIPASVNNISIKNVNNLELLEVHI